MASAGEVQLPEYSLIINPTDGSPAAIKATGHAIHLAKMSGAEMLVVYVIDESLARRFGVRVRREEEELKARAAQVTRAAVEAATSSGVRARAIVLEDQPGPAIVHIAKEHKASLMVMGFSGFPDIERFLTRTATVWREMLREPPCPLLLVPQSAEG